MKRSLYLGLLFSFICSIANASHYMGGQITYKWINGTNYVVKLTLYRDCSGIALGTSSNVIIKSATAQLNVILPKVSVRDVSLLCPTQVSPCSGGSGSFGIEEHIYQDTVNLPPLNGNDVYTIETTGLCCRNNAITTLTAPGSQQLFLSAILNPNLPQKNTSPDLLNIPIANFAPNQTAALSPSGFDADGDKLVYSFTSAKDAGSYDPVQYVSGFNATNPLTSSTPITINPNNGIISFTPSVTNQIAIIAIKVEEYRNGIKIGEITRDIQIRIFNITNNYPVINQVNNTVVPVGQTFCTNIAANDINNDSINLSLIGLVPNSNFLNTTNGVGYATGSFCFTPTALDAGRTYTFTVNAKDNHCPVVLTSSMTFNIIVPKPCASLNLTSTVTNASSCGNNDGAILLNSTSNIQPISYYWSGSTGFTANTQNINNVSSGSYRVIVVDGNNCSDVLNVDIINSNDSIVIDTTILSDCNKIKFRGIIYGTNTTIIDTFRNANGCDSAFHYNVLNVVKPVTNIITKVSCNGEKIKYGEKYYGVSTNFIDTIKSTKGCDSIYNNVKIIIKTVIPIVQTTSLVSCNGKLTWNGVVYNNSTILRDTIRTSEGCDSIYKQTNINISNIKPQYQNITVTGCQTVLYKSILYTKNTTIKDTLKSVYGCDSVYLNVAISITQPVTPSVVILYRGSDVNCKGANVSIKAFVTNGGTNPTYQWSVNGVDVIGATSIYFITNNLNNGDTVKCTIVSNNPCITNATAISNYLIAKIIEPIYQTINLSGCNKVVYDNNFYYNTTNFSDTVKNSLGCDSIVNNVNISINSIAIETVIINLSGCNSITYNGISYYTSTKLTDTLKSSQGCDSIYIVRNLNITRINPVTTIQNISSCDSLILKEKVYKISTVLRDTIRSMQGCDSIYTIINISITSSAAPTIVITSSHTSVPMYVPFLLTATTTNGGSNPQYKWYKNGVLLIGANSATLSQTLFGITPNQTIVYTCELTSNAECVSKKTVASNAVSIFVSSPTNAATSISIAANVTTICPGATVTFTSTTTNGGASPQYQWKKNGVNISGANNFSYSTNAIANNDVFTCAVTNGSTILSNSITITVNASIYLPNEPSTAIICPEHLFEFETTPISTTMPAGGVWSSPTHTVANGILTAGVKAGFPANYLHYTVTNSSTNCQSHAVKAIYIYKAPTPIIGNTLMCNTNTTTTLSTTSSPGVWTSSNPAVAVVSANINATQQQATITSIGSGTTIISFTVQLITGSFRTVSTTITVAPVTIARISGNSSICIGATTQLTNAIPNGVWSSVAGRATINSTGLVTGISSGVAQIRYTVTNATTGCSAYTIKNVTVSAMPSVPSIGYAPTTLNPQTGAGGGFCNNRTFDVVGTPIGGVWTSNNNSVMTVTTLGTVATVGLGTATLTYTVSNNGCSNSRSITGNVVGCAARGITGAANEKQETRDDFTMYPNPARTFISLNVETLVGTGNIAVNDLYGKQVKSQSLSMGTNTIDVSTLSKGMYFVSVIANERKITKKLIIN